MNSRSLVGIFDTMSMLPPTAEAVGLSTEVAPMLTVMWSVISVVRYSPGKIA